MKVKFMKNVIGLFCTRNDQAMNVIAMQRHVCIMQQICFKKLNLKHGKVCGGERPGNLLTQEIYYTSSQP